YFLLLTFYLSVMKVVITGAAGMLGHDLVSDLAGEGHEVIGTSRRNISGEGETKWVQLDITKPAETYNVLTKINPDLIIHCASHNDVDGSEKDPKTALMVNALGSKNV